MKKILLVAFIALVVTASILSPTMQAQVKNLTFIVNTATVPDTLKATDNVVLVGSGTGSADTALTSWGAGKALTNIGGDYWKTTLGFTVGDTLKYKIRVRANGYEKDLSDGFLAQGHRNYAVTNNDTTFPVQFWDNGPNSMPQYFRPWTTVPDTFINVYFRVNMQSVMDNGSFGWSAKDVDSVGVRGYQGGTTDDLSWDKTFYLKQEVAPGDGGSEFKIGPGSFYSGRLKFRKSAVHAGDTIQYKFLIGYTWGNDELQGGKPNRTFTIPVGKADTTLHWVFYNNDPPVLRSNADSCTVTFLADMTTASNNGSFNIGSDTVQVQVGFFNTSDSTRSINLIGQGLTNNYKGTVKLLSSANKLLDYQYYLVKGANQIRENYFNFQFGGTVASEQERRQVLVPGTAGAFTVSDVTVGVSAARRQPYFASQRKFSKNVTAKWTVDMRPAYYQIILGKDSLVDGQGSANVVKADSIKAWGVGINGPATNLPGVFPVGDWASWDRTMVADTNKRKMWDDGTHGDAVAGDTIYSVQFNYTTANNIGAVSKFGIRGGDNETAFGLNHLDNIDDAGSTTTINVQWGSINPNKYNHWNYDTQKPIYTLVADRPGVPQVYALQQNYPNPFNPTTKIAFSLPSQLKVELVVYNILGQKVATLVDETLKAGGHEVPFDASRLASGMYLYRITAGQFTSVKKMMLLK